MVRIRRPARIFGPPLYLPYVLVTNTMDMRILEDMEYMLTGLHAFCVSIELR